jgi:flagellar biosynthesis/type III secretory pathway M-ring protein FliF/YscJ
VDKARKGLNDFSSEVRYGVLLVLFLMVYMLTIRPIQKRILTAQAPAPAVPQGTLPAAGGMAAAPDSPAMLAQRSTFLKKQLTEFVLNEPETSVTAVRAWLQEEAQG